ncbi:MAG: glycosyltransferase family 1 protein [Parachlamydiaceae bacterium]|nr:glycosyltransferase family 1 protein [Parachlamydiaceae bacterium]
MKRKILIFLSLNPEDGGKFQYSITLLENITELDKNLFDVIALYYSDLWKIYLQKFGIQGYKISNAESFWFNKSRKLFVDIFPFLWLWRKINRYLSQVYKNINSFKPDLIIYPGGCNLSYEFDFPSIVPIFDLMHRYEDFPEVKEKTIYNSREKHYKNVCKYANGIFVDSKLGKSQVIESYKVDEKKIIVFPYQPPYYVYDFNDIDVITKYNLPVKYYFYPAQFWVHKNHKIIIEAVKYLNEKGIHMNVVCAGSEKNGYEKVITLIENYNLQNQFFILGYVNNDELVSLYKRAQALVFPTFFGPTNIPPLEALALGCPVLVSDVYAHREQLCDNVIYFDPFDYKDLASKLDLFCSNNFSERSKKNDNYRNTFYKIRQSNYESIKKIISELA